MKKILLLDESEIVRGIVGMILAARGYALVGIGDPADLGATLTKEVPDLVLLDVAMPGARMEALVARGRELAREGCPIFLYSDRPEHELARLVAASGANGYLRKGGDSAVFVRHVERLLGD